MKLDDYKHIVKLRIQTVFQNFLGEGDEVFGCYIYGNGLMGKFVYHQLHRFFDISGFVVSQKNTQEDFDEETGIKIYQLEEVSRNSFIIIASLLSWSDIYRSCIEKGYSKCCNYEEIAFFDKRFPPYNQAFKGIAEGILKNQERYHALFHCFADFKSQKIFEYVIQFRLSMDIAWTEKAFMLSQETGKQYFDREIIETTDEEVFLDCGGYHGETVIDFKEFTNGRYWKIYFFEPDSNLMTYAKENLRDIDRTLYLPFGVGETEDELSFNAVGDLSGSFCSQGTEKIKVVAIDDIIEEPVTFIKMDIEGMEQAALLGSYKTIQKYKPKLAISVYHNSTDMVDIAEIVLGFRNDYKVYLRHYTKGCADTVMYFI